MSDSKDSSTKREEAQRASFPCSNCGKTEFKVILKKDTIHRYLCPECKTPTYVYISPNLDIIMFREDEICPECGGTGKCSKCKGTGEMVCPVCNGAGYYKDYDYYRGCHRCGGKGKLWVHHMEDFHKEITKGSGLVRCDKCLGTGVCPTCNGYRGAWASKSKSK